MYYKSSQYSILPSRPFTATRTPPNPLAAFFAAERDGSEMRVRTYYCYVCVFLLLLKMNFPEMASSLVMILLKGILLLSIF